MSRFITYLACRHGKKVSAEDLKTSFQRLAGDAPMKFDLHGDANTDDNAAFIISVNSALVTVMFIDQQLPADAWQGAGKNTTIWSGASEAIQSTTNHIVVALMQDTKDHMSALNGAAAVTMISGAIAALLPINAVVFSESGSIVNGAQIVEEAQGFAQGEIPIMLWMLISFFRSEKIVSGRPDVGGRSSGLAAFIGREIVFTPAPLMPADIAERLVGLCQYLVTNGPVIKDGETVGLTEDEKFHVHYTKEGDADVMELRLEMAGANMSVSDGKA